MKVWITTEALTKGIIEVEAKTTDKFGPDTILSTTCNFYHGENDQWHRTKEGAIKKAEKMRKEEIDILLITLRELEFMSFN